MQSAELPKPPKVPCGTCPYRKDVPSGVWAKEEYKKLPGYDGETREQHSALFMCHQQDGCLCGGWLMTHDPQHLLALRINRVDASAFDYHPDVEVFSSGLEACMHGMQDVAKPSPAAKRKIDGLVKQRDTRKRKP